MGEMSEKDAKKLVEQCFEVICDEKYDIVVEYFRNFIQEDTAIQQEVFKEIPNGSYPWICEYGLNVRFSIDDQKCSISLDLDHLGDKEDIKKLIANRKLFREIMMLYRLAHLPFTECAALNFAIGDDRFDIIDRVRINLHKAFHPLDRSKFSKENIREIHPDMDDYGLVEAGIAWLKKRNSIL